MECSELELKSPILYDTLRDLLVTSLSLLKASQDVPQFFPPLGLSDFQAQGDGVVGPVGRWTWIPSIDIKEHIQGNVVSMARAKCFEDDELRRRLDFVALSGVGGGRRSFETIYQLSVLEAYVEQARSYDLDPDIFNSLYRDFEADLFADVRRLKSILPICGLDGGDWLERPLDDGITFRRLTPAELVPCVQSQAVPFRIFGTPSFYVSPTNRWALVAELNLPISYYDPTVSADDLSFDPFQLPDLRSHAQTIVEATRLFGGSVVATRQVTPIPFTKFDFAGSHLDEFWITYPAPNPNNCVNISEEESSTFWNTFAALKSNSKHAVAVRRLVSSALRNDPEDVLIDLAIALESLFSDSGQGSEITEKVSLRAALVAPPFDLSPKKVRSFIRLAYQLRSQIAHGGRPKPDKIKNLDGQPCDLAAMVQDLDSFLRQVVLRSLVDHELLNHDANLERLLSSIS